MLESTFIDNAKNEFQFHNFVNLEESKLLEILTWRNHPEISKWMFNSNPISIKEHLTFCSGLRFREDCSYWLVSKAGKDLGVVNLTNFRKVENTGEWGFYLKPEFFRSGKGLELFYMAQYFFFRILKISVLKGMVQVDNKNAITLNDFFGMKHKWFQELNGIQYSYREQVSTDWSEEFLDKKKMNKCFIEYLQELRNK